jgi:hypothetical protein
MSGTFFQQRENKGSIGITLIPDNDLLCILGYIKKFIVFEEENDQKNIKKKELESLQLVRISTSKTNRFGNWHQHLFKFKS